MWYVYLLKCNDDSTSFRRWSLSCEAFGNDSIEFKYLFNTAQETYSV